MWTETSLRYTSSVVSYILCTVHYTYASVNMQSYYYIHIVFLITCIFISPGPVGWYIHIYLLPQYISTVQYRRTYALCTCMWVQPIMCLYTFLTIYLYHYYFYVVSCIVRCCEHLSAFSLHTGGYSWCHFTLGDHVYCIACVVCWASGPCYLLL